MVINDIGVINDLEIDTNKISTAHKRTNLQNKFEDAIEKYLF